ncbi:4'-phosphopantetheinyl transferase [Acidisarcina polymorpha]|uniref:4'-phosphopantetheinyl transferase n=1 Tax=Acidisarcina polymorpha TaxID=2211140 RepID=A0A2Z5G8B1_9BACT|nr:4'-phosphopantetheinyl transferase superfamily protein [Acidisarcina polymorpha]AXC15057.1 4'-phosphopantetheinyl transferase [Acidisarcina polymorpha]
MAPRNQTQAAVLLWPARRLPFEIGAGEVHLWAWGFAGSSTLAGEDLRTEDLRTEDLRILDDRERARTARFHFLPDRIRYSVCHANMRRILGSYLDMPPESLLFREGAGGKPELDGVVEVRFNLSHSKSVAVLGVALGMEIGVDVEDIHPIETGVAERFFSAAELARLRGLRGTEWLDGFYRCWTRKEAILKGEGVGLRIPLDSFDVSLLADEPTALLAARPESKLRVGWRLHALAAAEGTMGALAVDHPDVRLCMSSFSG